MGLRMDDIHTPSVSSGQATSQGLAKPLGEEHLALKDLIIEKQRVEEELSALSSVLDTHGVNMDTSLTTFDGYPRDDLDVAQIRTTRARIIRLRNDYKTLMSKIEDGLHAHHASIEPSGSHPASNSVQEAATANSSNTASSGAYELPFAKVTDVTAGSPADHAGLRVGDKIRRFGTVNWMNHEELGKVAETVQRNEGRNIGVSLSRQHSNDLSSEELLLQLIPQRNWGGRGLLGCHLVPT